jgi:hypothetical protein
VLILSVEKSVEAGSLLLKPATIVDVEPWDERGLMGMNRG